MSEELNQERPSPETGTCATCLFYYLDSENQAAKCMRFARFVDHVITGVTKDCSYWADRNDV
ncbi:MAG: hypothetical protein JW736_00855 [Deltaproteobacteria bacterium]|nr:hypothetical protein [Deltaproteobacteria bacterium]MBN2687071.1 hypothetical protein [Deltaproteobacteria bacterium]